MTTPDWATRGIEWRTSLTPATADSPTPSDREPRVFNISVSSPADAARQLNRIYNSRKVFDDARQSPVQADPIDAPLDTPTGGEKGASKAATPKVAVPKGADTPQAPATAPSSPATTPQAPTSPPATGEPSTSTPSPSTLPLQELGVLPGGTNPVTVPNYPVVDPGSTLPVVVATALPEGSSLQQTSTAANGIRVTETTVTTPGLAPVTTTKITEEPVVAATVECTVPVPLAQPGVLPPSITNPQTIFQTGSNYSREQLEADLKAFEAGQLVWVGPNGPTAYDVARARLTAAMYTPGEQFNDLVWANHVPRNQAEIEERFAAVTRLNQAGIPWLDPAIAAWVTDQQQITVAEDPYSTVDNTRPSMYSPAELRRQALEASRTELTAGDLKQGLNGFLVGATVGPALILWDAAHDRGDYSGAEIAWAAAELGINTASIIPGLGTLTGAAAKAGLRRIAPKTWEALAAADNAVDAVRIGRTTQQRELTDAVDNYRQRTVHEDGLPGTPSTSPASRPEGSHSPDAHAETAGWPSEVPSPVSGRTERPTDPGPQAERTSTDIPSDAPHADISTRAEVRTPGTGLHRGGLSGIDENGWQSVFPSLSGPRLDHAVERLRLEVMNRNDIDRIRQSARSAGFDIDASVLREIKHYNFNSRGLQFSTENYNAWTRLGNGSATVGDVRYIVHEASEVKALQKHQQQTGFDYMGAEWDRMSPAQRKGWEATFDEAYTAAHSQALAEEYRFLTDTINDVTNGNIRMRPEVAASIDRRPEARERMFVGEVPLGQSAQFAAWKMAGSQLVTLTGSGASRLGLPRGTQLSQSELLQRVKFLRVGSWR
ncbi:hypothetical protein [Nocardia asteroides]|uniref:hypothetical protein n=1 Tax=Nocardia asteroides TaxID=1824 RepID=UPI0033C3E0A4